MSLLEEVRKITHVRKLTHQPTKEEKEVVLAWLDGEITVPQISKALNITSQVTIYKLCKWVKVLYDEGLIKKA